MSVIRLYYGRDTDEMLSRLRNYLDATFATEPVKALEIRETVLNDSVIEVIIELLKVRKIESIELDDCGAYMTNHGNCMAVALGTVENLRLSEPTFVSKKFLYTLVSSATKLNKLRIQDQFDRQKIEALALGLRENTTIKELDLSRSRIHSFHVLTQGLKYNKQLEVLRLRSLDLYDGNVGDMLKALKAHPSLKTIDLSFNHFRDLEGMTDLIGDSQCHIEELIIGHQNLWQSTKVCFLPLAVALQQNNSIQKLGLARNKLVDSDIAMFLASLAKHKSIASLDLRDNCISDEGIAMLMKSVKNSKNIRRIDIRGNMLGMQGALSILDAVRKNVNIFAIETDTDTPMFSEIRLATALNRGGRGLLREQNPLALWPIVFARLNSSFLNNKEKSFLHFPPHYEEEVLNRDVLFHLVKHLSFLFQRNQ